MMTTLLPLFRVPTSFTPFDGERFIGVCSASVRRLFGVCSASVRRLAPFLFSFLSRMETPAERTPGGLCDTHG
ncbi:hypothetical protein HB503_001759 [Salmonella enterica subsp. enterica]|nr:hypothetical protein [Salmonella enterica subsp. enterica serovar Mississippi]EEP8081171.1 hypothetical protein [Salmonella enterica subsp. enterica]EIU4233841.1 hypothetical protein [Salmonella enterica]